MRLFVGYICFIQPGGNYQHSGFRFIRIGFPLMASNALARVSGFVLKVDRIQGVSKNSGEPYDFTQVKIVVADSDVTEVTLPRDLSKIGGYPSKGEFVDFLVDFRINATGKSISGNVQENYPADATAAA